MSNKILIYHPKKYNLKIIELLDSKATKMHYREKTILFSPGDELTTIGYVIEGRIRSYSINQDGIEKTTHIYNNGWFLREGVLIYDKPLYASRYTVTETPTTLYLINSASFVQLMKYPLFYNELIKSSWTKVELLRGEIESMAFDSGKDRLLNLLIGIADKKNVIDNQWYNVIINYTHQELSGIIGINRVTVSRFISELCKDGYIRIVNRHIQINKDQANNKMNV